jgi:hypothetical protein
MRVPRFAVQSGPGAWPAFITWTGFELAILAYEASEDTELLRHASPSYRAVGGNRTRVVSRLKVWLPLAIRATTAPSQRP